MEELVITDAKHLPQVAEGLKLASEINGFGYEAYLVGGCVRDLVRWKLGLDAEPSIHDVDLATNMPAEEMARHFKTASNNGEKHGTILVFMDGIPFEVTRFRADGEYSDGRHPDSIEFADTFEEDTRRRDFTMNAMGMDSGCRVLDYHGGIASIRSGILSTVGSPMDRFNEDALRILRAGRFSARFGMQPDLSMLSACRALAPRLKFLSMERVHDELAKCSTPDSFGGMLRFLEDGMGKPLSAIIDWKSAARGVENWKAYHQEPWDSITGMSILFSSFDGDPEPEMRRFKCTVEEISACKFAGTMYRKYHSGKLDLVDMVDLVNDRKWPAFVGVVNAYDGRCAIDGVQVKKLRRLGSSYPTQKDITRMMTDRGIAQGKAFGKILRHCRLCIYKHNVDGRRMADSTYLDKLVADVRREYE